MMRHVVVTVILGLVIVASSLATKMGQLELIVRSDKTSHVLGELVQFEFEVRNSSKQDFVILSGLRPVDGYLSVWISKDGKAFERYDHTRWGTADSARITKLKSNESAINKAFVFWNSRPNISSAIAVEVAKGAAAGRILTDYAFPEAGIYYLKASYSIFVEGQEEAIRLESPPIKLNITEPTGNDLSVWREIKDNGDIAFLMQEGDLPIESYKTDERSKLKKDVEEIINKYPSSLIVRQMETGLQELRITEEKMRVFSEKLRRPN